MPLDELGGLLNPQPQPEIDPEGGLLVDDVQLFGNDEQLAGLVNRPPGLRAIRTDITLDEGQYSGRATSRAAVYGEDGVNGLLNGSSSSSSDEQERQEQQQEAAPRQLYTEIAGLRALTPGTVLYQVTPPMDITAYPTMFVNGHINHGPGPNDPTSSSSSYGTESSSEEQQLDTAAAPAATAIGNGRSQQASEQQHQHQQLPQLQVDILSGQQHQLLQQHRQQQSEQAANLSAAAAAPGPGSDSAELLQLPPPLQQQQQQQQQQPSASEGSSSSGNDSSSGEGSRGCAPGEDFADRAAEAAVAPGYTSATATAIQQQLSLAASGFELAGSVGDSRPGLQVNTALEGEPAAECDQQWDFWRAGQAREENDTPEEEQQNTPWLNRQQADADAAAGAAAIDASATIFDTVAGMSAVLGDDDRMLQLEREAAAVRAEAAQQLLEAAERGSKDASKAAGVRAQKRLWGAALEMRIRLQRAVMGANVLPRPQQKAALTAADPTIAARYSDLLRSCQAVLENMLALHSALAQQHPAAAAAASQALQQRQQEQHEQQAGSAGGSKRRRSQGIGLLATGALQGNEQAAEAAASTGYGGLCSDASSAWAAVSGAISSLAGFRDASLDKWHRRTVLSSSTAALRGSGGLRALQQSISSQVSALMYDKQKLISRSQLPRQLAPRPLGQPAAALEPAKDDAGDVGAVSSDHSRGRDTETFDEGDFYQQLLKELIESAPLGSLPADQLAARPAKRRKLVDRRASKGRKIRFHTMEKLVNFMAPADLVPPPFAEQLFANLFSPEGH